MTGVLPSGGYALGDVAEPRSACRRPVATFALYGPWLWVRFMFMLAIGVATFFFPMAAVCIFGSVLAAVLSLKALAREPPSGGRFASAAVPPGSGRAGRFGIR